MGKLPPKKGKGKLPLFCGNGERVIPFYAQDLRPSHERNAMRQINKHQGSCYGIKNAPVLPPPSSESPHCPPQ